MERCLSSYGKAKKRSAVRAIRSRFDPSCEPGERLRRRAEMVLHSVKRGTVARTTEEEQAEHGVGAPLQ